MAHSNLFEIEFSICNFQYYKSIDFDILSAWMLANVNVGQVQPQGNVEHLSDTERSRKDMLHEKMPILAAEATLGTIQEVDSEISSTSDGISTSEGISITSADRDQISVTSMDMLIDRERMSVQHTANYGSVAH